MNYRKAKPTDSRDKKDLVMLLNVGIFFLKAAGWCLKMLHKFMRKFVFVFAWLSLQMLP